MIDAANNKEIKYIGHQEEKYATTKEGASYNFGKGKIVEIPKALAEGLIKSNPEDYEEVI